MPQNAESKLLKIDRSLFDDLGKQSVNFNKVGVHSGDFCLERWFVVRNFVREKNKCKT